jgi:hypothetical protein
MGTQEHQEGISNSSSFRTFFARSEGCRLGLKTTHNPKVAGSNPAPATKYDKGLAGSRLTPSLSLLTDWRLVDAGHLHPVRLPGLRCVAFDVRELDALIEASRD